MNDEDMSKTFIDEDKRIGLGHNLLSIFNQINEKNEIIDNIEMLSFIIPIYEPTKMS